MIHSSDSSQISIHQICTFFSLCRSSKINRPLTCFTCTDTREHGNQSTTKISSRQAILLLSFTITTPTLSMEIKSHHLFSVTLESDHYIVCRNSISTGKNPLHSSSRMQGQCIHLKLFVTSTMKGLSSGPPDLNGEIFHNKSSVLFQPP